MFPKLPYAPLTYMHKHFNIHMHTCMHTMLTG